MGRGGYCAAWMTAIDLLIDRLAAVALGYWRGAAPGAYYGIPARNFLGWFIVSLLIFAMVRGGHRGWTQRESRRSAHRGQHNLVLHLSRAGAPTLTCGRCRCVIMHSASRSLFRSPPPRTQSKPRLTDLSKPASLRDRVLPGADYSIHPGGLLTASLKHIIGAMIGH
jgi:Carotenoid biosynthesis protein